MDKVIPLEYLEELDSIVAKVIESKLQLLSEEILEVEPFRLTENRAKYHLSVLERFDLISSYGTGLYEVTYEEMKIWASDGGFVQRAKDQTKEINEEKIYKQAQAKLTEAQLRQVNHALRRMILKEWWFWIAALLVLGSFVLSFLTFLRG